MLAFVARRFGREAAERAAAPALIGVFAGDAAALSMRSALPRVAGMEREHGSVLRALMRRSAAARARAARSRFPTASASCRPRSRERSAAAAVPARAAEIAPIAGGWRVVTETGATHRRRAPGARDARRRDRGAAVAARARGRRRAAGDSPRAGRRRLRWVSAPPPTWASDPRRLRLRGRARRGRSACSAASTKLRYSPIARPTGGVLLRALLGGTFDPGLVDADDGAIAAQAVGDLRRAAGLSARSRLRRRLARTPRNSAVRPRHAARVRAVDDAVARLPGLAVIGNALRGVGVNDCIAAAARVAGELTPHTRS